MDETRPPKRKRRQRERVLREAMAALESAAQAHREVDAALADLTAATVTLGRLVNQLANPPESS